MSDSPERTARKRSKSRSPPPWRRPQKTLRIAENGESRSLGRVAENLSDRGRRSKENQLQKAQAQINQLQEDERMREWVAQEDVFVLNQAKKKAQIRTRDGRAKQIDLLAVTLYVIDPTRNPLDNEVDEADLDIVDPDGVFEGLSRSQLVELEKDIDAYIKLETNAKNKDYWQMMKILCVDRRNRSGALGPEGRAVSSVSSDIDRLLGSKSPEELDALERQINRKLDSNEPIDTDYWEQLLKSLLVWKARAKLKLVYQAVIDSRQSAAKTRSLVTAAQLRERLTPLIPGETPVQSAITSISVPQALDNNTEPFLQVRPEDKKYDIIDESKFLDRIAADRRKVEKAGIIRKSQAQESMPLGAISRPVDVNTTSVPRFNTAPSEDFSNSTKTLYEKEAARGIDENEEIFAGEEEVDTKSLALWSGRYRPRKPRYFNRVQMGYEWNKYNQTHYDHDNPPPKVVQGYKFNIFYPDLIDKTKAPTYRIEREGGRKRGQSFAPAGEEDTCVIRFISGPPYEDVAFRIVDKEWDYSAKRDRGFKSSFDKGILQLSFQFKKIYYRK